MPRPALDGGRPAASVLVLGRALHQRSEHGRTVVEGAAGADDDLVDGLEALEDLDGGAVVAAEGDGNAVGLAVADDVDGPLAALGVADDAAGGDGGGGRGGLELDRAAAVHAGNQQARGIGQ